MIVSMVCLMGCDNQSQSSRKAKQEAEMFNQYNQYQDKARGVEQTLQINADEKKQQIESSTQ